MTDWVIWRPVYFTFGLFWGPSPLDGIGAGVSGSGVSGFVVMSLDEETSTVVSSVALTVAVAAVVCSVGSRVGKTGICTCESLDSEKAKYLEWLVCLILKLHLLISGVCNRRELYCLLLMYLEVWFQSKYRYDSAAFTGNHLRLLYSSF